MPVRFFNRCRAAWRGAVVGTLIGVAGLGLACDRASAQQADFPPSPNSQVAMASAPQSPTGSDVEAQLEQQQLEIQRLQAQLAGMQTSSSNGQVEAMPVASTTAAPTTASPDGGTVVGSDLTVKSDFRNGLFLWFATPNNDFTMHLGGWEQWDNVWWNQATALKTAQGARSGPAQGVASGADQGGIGNLADGEYFRRLRLFVEGTFYEQWIYRLNFAFENDQFDTIGLDEFWFGEQSIPYLGEVRLGHVKTPMGLEGDMSSSSRCMTFMERSAYSEAIELNQNFCTGLWIGNNFDEVVTWQSAIFRTDNKQASGVYFGDGQFGLQARLTALPIYQCDGRELLHFGISGGWRDGSSNNATSPYRTFELSARPELRDDDPSAADLVPNANDNRMIDTGAIAANDEFLVGLETLAIMGPFSFQAEYGWNWLDGAIGVAPSGSTFNPVITPPQDYVFSGGYVQLAYTLTGENRAYDRKYGCLAREYYGKAGPYEDAFLVRDGDGHICGGWGAWEIAMRYSYVDLNDGPAGPATRIQGGIMDGFTLGLNWYANQNLNVMWDWVFDNRYALPAGSDPGWTSGFGVEVQFQF